MSEAPTLELVGRAGNGEKAAVAIVDLHKSFGALEVLNGVSLTARQGDVVSILLNRPAPASRRCCAASISSRPRTAALSEQRQVICV